jgi:Holliday junction resolvase
MSGGHAPRDKSGRMERAIVRLAQDTGFGAERVPLSGSAGGRYSGDISIPLLGVDRLIECKARANGFTRLYDWLQGRDALILKADRKDALLVVPLRLALAVAWAAEKACHKDSTTDGTASRRSAWE